jgi:hypothetical protein
MVSDADLWRGCGAPDRHQAVRGLAKYPDFPVTFISAEGLFKRDGPSDKQHVVAASTRRIKSASPMTWAGGRSRCRVLVLPVSANTSRTLPIDAQAD